MPTLPLWAIVVAVDCEAVTAMLDAGEVLVALVFVPTKTAL